jgi:ankyrin repeat protein
VNKRNVAVIGLGALVALSSAYSQTTDFFELVKAGTPQHIQAAIDNGANVKARDKNGGTVLMFAADYNLNPEAISTLLKAGADAKVKDSAGKTALAYLQDKEDLVGFTAHEELQKASQ